MPNYLLKITLKYTPYPVWRRIIVPAHIKVHHFHRVLQIVMGWQDRQVHTFKAGSTYFAPGEYAVHGFRAEEKFILADLYNMSGRNIKYFYGLNRDWEHVIETENIDYPNPDRSHPIRCIDGAGACPPEGCEYGDLEKLCEMINGTADEYDAELKKRYRKFAPNRFSTRTINRIFKINPKNYREPPAVPDRSEGMIEIFNEQVEALRQIEKRSKSRKKNE
ncbi:MAG: plasmid pRiA4b ORF-3 family protein [Planctomycetaceae bacterium]|nr:plasmid pRiA4b ORF-3 family protein [Planctomycetaceae bacterium]